MNIQQTISALLLFLLITSSCAPPLRESLPRNSKELKKDIVLCITTKDGKEHKIKLIRQDEKGIYGYRNKFFAYEDILYLEREKPNPTNIGIALLTLTTTAALVTAYFAIQVARWPFAGEW